MSDLYPLRFESILKERVWGGRSLPERYNKKTDITGNIGESWEISSVSDNISVVSNGFLAGNNLEELIEVYMGDITGDSVYEKFGNEFPLLIKLIESKQDLSVQVHPGNELAKKRHNAYGKTEMWYILENEKNAKAFIGFQEDVTKDSYLDAVKKGNLPEIMNVEIAEKGDAFFIPAGSIHSLGSGLILVEIQQTSDITYRIFDWNRSGSDKRELHTDLALDAIDFSRKNPGRVKIDPVPNDSVNIVDNEFFTTFLVSINELTKKEYYLLDSFVIYICTEGRFIVKCDDFKEEVKKGETILIPAMIKEVILEPLGEARFLEVYINESINIL
ncbi:MAG TPA: type I phosphomannose isomerase catalytic subunit [Bacteroidales bacterium]|nr:type I phosphomannose isomerase catalytic subunit [Bacteroidales bacterium]